MYFFFSSRRRHTRLQGDWNSDVCSSDLAGPRAQLRSQHVGGDAFGPVAVARPALGPRGVEREIGSASCRERMSIAGGAGTWIVRKLSDARPKCRDGAEGGISAAAIKKRS